MTIKNTTLKNTDEIIFISDVHFGVRNGSFEWLEIMQNYFKDFFIPLIRNEISSGKHPIVVVAGDYFDNRQYIDINVMNVAYNVMKEISSLCEVYMVIGNHDIYKKNDTDVNSLVIFSDFKNVKIVDKIESITLCNGRKFLLVSWIGDRLEENKVISKYKDNYDYLVFHTELSGMSYDNNKPILNGLNLSIADDNCRILSGHIHKRQESKKAMYFGSPYHLSRSDIGNEKGIYIFSAVDDKIEKRFIKNEISPTFKRVNFSEVGKDPKDWAEIMEGNFVDIVMNQTEIDSINVNKFLKGIQDNMPKHVEIVKVAEKPVEVDTTLPTTPEDYTKFDTNTIIEEVFKTRINAMGLKDKQVKELTDMNEKFIKTALEDM